MPDLWQNICLHILLTCPIFVNVWSRHDHLYMGLDHRHHHHLHYEKDNDLSLWINEMQVKMFSGFSMKIYAIDNGKVSPHIKDPNFNIYLPTIPSEVSYVNFTWKSGAKKYDYHFDRLQSLDENILKPPIISIKTKGRVPRNPKEFSVLLPCSGNVSGIAMFSIGLLIQTRKGPDPECDKKCANNGWCNHEKICQCPEGYMGQYCTQALCYPQCQNGGNCTAPAICSCPRGYQGRHCEGGICAEKCLNGGKCIQKDKCECPKGFLGHRCEISKCTIPCQNNGKCIGPNKCRCPAGIYGEHCEVGRRQRSTCKKPCKRGVCMPDHKCHCFEGWFGKFCARREKHSRPSYRSTPKGRR